MTHRHPSPVMNSLPFVYRPLDQETDSSNWHVPETDDYAEACCRGREYAAQFVQLLKDKPDLVESNLLGNIVSDIDFTDESAMKGYHVGFFSYLERLLHGQGRRMDLFEDVERLNASTRGHVPGIREDRIILCQ